ncbi:hypothetical protein ACLB2K_046645 [Fragaria x ananassa]
MAFLLPDDNRGIPDDFTMKMKAVEIRFEGLGSNLHLTLQTRTVATANWYTTSPPTSGMSQSRSGVRSARGEASSAPDGGERRDVRTLRAVRMSSFERIRVCVCKIRSGRPSVLLRPAPAKACLYLKRLQQPPRPLSLTGESVLFQFSGEITQNFKLW